MINNQAALCELTKLAADPVQEITKPCFPGRTRGSRFKVEIVGPHSGQRFDLGQFIFYHPFAENFCAEVPQPIFNVSDSCHQQDREKDTLSIQTFCRNCGRKHSSNEYPTMHRTCYQCGKVGHFKLSVARQARIMLTMSTQTKIAFTWIQCLQLETVMSLFPCNNNLVSMQLDSGAACSILPHHIALSLKLPIQPTNRWLCAYDGKQLKVVGQTLVSLKLDGKCWQQDFVLVVTLHKFGLLAKDILSLSLTDFCRQVSESICLLYGDSRPRFASMWLLRTESARRAISLFIWKMK